MIDTFYAYSEAWLKPFKDTGMFPPDFVPFRLHTKVEATRKGETFTYWITWFPTEKGELLQLSEKGEEVTDWLILGSIDDSVSAIANRLNELEEQEYRKRIEELALPGLRKQQQMWNALQRKFPRTVANRGLFLTYPPLRLLSDEIQKQMLDSVLDSNPTPQKQTTFDKSEKVKIIIVREKYTLKHFREVDRLIQRGYKKESAYQEVAEKHNFVWENFARQYRDRHQNTTRKGRERK
jgi:hypothetical protein